MAVRATTTKNSGKSRQASKVLFSRLFSFHFSGFQNAFLMKMPFFAAARSRPESFDWILNSILEICDTIIPELNTILNSWNGRRPIPHGIFFSSIHSNAKFAVQYLPKLHLPSQRLTKRNITKRIQKKNLHMPQTTASVFVHFYWKPILTSFHNINIV